MKKNAFASSTRRTGKAAFFLSLVLALEIHLIFSTFPYIRVRVRMFEVEITFLIIENSTMRVTVACMVEFDIADPVI